MSFRLIVSTAALFGIMTGAWAASPQVKQMDVNADHVTSWNRFAASVYDLHKRQIGGREIRQTEVTGEYHGSAARGYAYKEISYHDAQTGLLLSRVSFDRDRPNILHTVEVFIHDPQGRVMRDFASIYLPMAQNAPIRTLINVHRYNNGLHAYRQFDASGNRIYEQCKGAHAGTQVDISLEQQDIGPPTTASETYRACFDGVQETVGAYLVPH